MRFSWIGLFSLSLFFVPLNADAGEDSGGLVHELKAGVLHHDQDSLWSNSSRESGVDGNVELIFNAGMPLWTGTLRPALGATINAGSDTSKLYGAARWETEVGENFLFALGIGGAIHNGETALVRNDKKALGSRALLYFPIEAGYRINERQTISLFFDHVSNAWLADPNEGMDTLGIRYGIRF